MHSQSIVLNQAIKWNEQLLVASFIGESQILFHTKDEVPVQIALTTLHELIQKKEIIILNNYQNTPDSIYVS